jgi:DNA repair protein RecN (Recombination protein N)
VLSDLLVRNFAIIEQLELSFDPGLTIITGETGAGKSILIGAVNLLLGSRASQELIRSGAQEAEVQGLFHLAEPSAVGKRLDEAGIPHGGELIIRRTIHRNGKNRVFLNNRMVGLQLLQDIARGLVAISGQHEHQILLDAEVHLELLDQYGQLGPPVTEVGRIYQSFCQTRDALDKLREHHREHAAKLDWLRFQLREIEAAALQPDEDDQLESERNRLHHAVTLRDAASSAQQVLYTDRGAVLEQLALVAKSLDSLTRIDPDQQEMHSHLNEARIHLEELAHLLKRYLNRIQVDPQRLAAVDDRLQVIRRLGKKYGPKVSDMLARAQELREAIAGEEGSEQSAGELESRLAELGREYLEQAAVLSRLRREAAERLAREVEHALHALDMPKARFLVWFDPASGDRDANPRAFSTTGLDRVELRFSANPGEDLKPLARVASGGELSRLLLAVKTLLGGMEDTETLVFDEVDAGIGGKTAELVGLQLDKLGRRHQVICITHLPQIACYGSHHLRVEKESGEHETSTRVARLDPESRVEELARMMGGITISDKTRAHAREFLQRAQRQRTGVERQADQSKSTPSRSAKIR